jgi:hypothetical protein
MGRPAQRPERSAEDVERCRWLGAGRSAGGKRQVRPFARVLGLPQSFHDDDGLLQFTVARSKIGRRQNGSDAKNLDTTARIDETQLGAHCTSMHTRHRAHRSVDRLSSAPATSGPIAAGFLARVEVDGPESRSWNRHRPSRKLQRSMRAQFRNVAVSRSSTAPTIRTLRTHNIVGTTSFLTLAPSKEKIDVSTHE